MGDLISIIIPTYNRASTLPKSIQSVLDQSAGNWELVIIDDGSSDNTKKAIERFLPDERIKYFYQENSGVSAARNKGVALSSGDFLIFLDSDDRLFPGLVNKLNKIHFKKFDLICWQVLKKIDGKKSIWKAQKLEKIYHNIQATFLAGSICYKKDIFLKAGQYDQKMFFGENYELGIRVSNLKNLKIRLLDDIFLEYKMETSRRTSNSLINKLNANYYLLSKHMQKYQEDSYSYSRLKYQLGFLNEKAGKRKEALKFYYQAWQTKPFYLKAFLKILFLKGEILLKLPEAQ